MSWFSDLAKTALNEAQKRIDKVLDIEDEKEAVTTPSNSSFDTPGSGSVLQSSLEPPANAVEAGSKFSSSQKNNVTRNVNKKKGKPSKLGSSLSRFHGENKTTRSSIGTTLNNDRKEKALPDKLLDSFTEISLKTTYDNDPGQKKMHEEKVEASEQCESTSETQAFADSVVSSTIPETTPAASFFQQNISLGTNEINYYSPAQKTIELDSFAGDFNLASCEEGDQENIIRKTTSLAPNLTEENNDIYISPESNLTASLSPHLHGSEFNESDFAPPIKQEILLHSVPENGAGINLDISSVMDHDGEQLATKIGSTLVEKSLQTSMNILHVSEKTLALNLTNEAQFINDDTEKPSDEFHVDSIINPSNTDIDVSVETCKVKDQSIDSDKSDIDMITHEEISDEVIEVCKTVQDSPQQVGLTTETTEVLSVSNDSEEVMLTTQETNTQLKPDSDEKTKRDVYEQQLMTLSLNNAKLSEENDNLRTEITQQRFLKQETFQQEQAELLQTIDHLSEQLQDSELKYSEQADELRALGTELSTRLSNEQVQHLLAEKEESIKGLLQEGEVLSKQHLQQNKAIKKLRSKLSEQEQSNTDLTEKVSKLEEMNKTLKTRLAEIQGQSSEDRGTVEKLSEAFQEKEVKLSDMQCRLEEAEEKRRAAQSTLDVAYKDIAELNKKLASQQSEREQEMERNEAAVVKKMEQEIEKIRQDHEHYIHMHVLQIGELRASIERTEAICVRREDQLRKEVADLQQRLQESDLRNHELSDSISESTRPLQRQIENLQSTYSNQTKNWETLEKSLTSRLGDAQMQLTLSQEKERSMQMALVEFKSRTASLEQLLSDVRGEKNVMKVELNEFKSNSTHYEEKLLRLTKELEQIEQISEETKTKARRDKVTLENQLDMEKLRSEVDRKKLQSQLDTVQKEKERLLWMNRSESMTSSASLVNAEVESVTSSSDTFNNFDFFDRQNSIPAPSNGVYDSIRSGTAGSTLLENLQSQLKQRDGEIAQFQGEINTLERTRASMAEEIVRLTNDNEDLEEVAKEVEDLKKSLKEVEARHEAVLTMYGEKAEEAEELKMDLEDVKMMYRQQIDSLLKSAPVK